LLESGYGHAWKVCSLDRYFADFGYYFVIEINAGN
jgi:hypothetical protein